MKKNLILSLFPVLIFVLVVTTIPNASSVPSDTYIVTDIFGEKLHLITTNGTVNTIASGIGDPRGVVIDSNGNYIVNDFNGRLLKITPQGSVTTITSGLFSLGLAIDSNGNYIVPDFLGQKLVKITPTGTITTITNNLPFPTDVAIDSGGNYIVPGGFGDPLLFKVTQSGAISTIASHIGSVSEVAIDSVGNYILPEITGNLEKISPQGIVTKVFLNIPETNLLGIAIDSNGNYIVTSLDGDLLSVKPDGTATKIASGAGGLWDVAISSIKTHQQALGDLIKLGNSFGANTSVLGNAVKLLSDSNPSNDKGVCGKLGAFIDQVNGNHSLTAAQKSQLIAPANAIKTKIGC